MGSEYKLVFSELAETQFNDIYDYIALKLFDRNAAEKLLREFDAKLRNVALFPKLCPKFIIPEHEDTDVRKCVVRNYIVFYLVNDANKTVYVQRVEHGSRDLNKLL